MDAPLASLRKYVAYIRKAIRGEPFNHDGPIYTGIRARLDQQPARATIPMHIAGEGPRMLALAGETADGAILNISTPWYLREVALRQVRAGAERVGRDPNEVEITSVVTCCVGDDRQAVLRNARAAFMERLSGSGVHIVRGQPPEVRPAPFPRTRAIIEKTLEALAPGALAGR